MENNEIVGLVVNKLNSEDMWFTQKTDPTWCNPTHYYKLDEYGDLTEGAIKEIVKEVKSYIGDGAVSIDDAIDIWVQEALADCRIDYKGSLVTKFKDKPIVDGIEAYNSNMLQEKYNNIKESSDYISKYDELNEDYKRRLKEENNKSANLISQMFQADDFDSDSKAGQIVMRTSELFNALSDKGYDVQVAFDNGESTNTILLGQQGGQVVITITNTDQPLRAFTSGNFEITDDNIKILTDIKDQISTI